MIRFRTIDPEAAAKGAAPSASPLCPGPAQAEAATASHGAADAKDEDPPRKQPSRAKKPGASRLFDE